MNRLAFLTGDAVISPDADRTTIADIVISFAAVTIQETHDRLQITIAMLQPYFRDLNILHQQHRFIDVPLMMEAREGLVTATNLLNIARFRLNGICAVVTPGLAWNLEDVHSRGLGVHVMLHRAEAINREILHSFHRVASPNRTVFRSSFHNHP